MVKSEFLLLSAAVLVCCLIPCVVTADEIRAAIGDKVNLSGTALVTDSLYLFVTGPGLPSNGVRPDSMKNEVTDNDPSSFTMVDVSNDHWSYTWNTARQGFSLKEGIYTFYAAKQPYGADNPHGVYNTITVTLTYGGVPWPEGGKISISTSPVPAEIYLNGALVGLSPAVIDAPVGNSTLVMKAGGYRTVEVQVPVGRGSVVRIERVMEPAPSVYQVEASRPLTTRPDTLSSAGQQPAAGQSTTRSIPLAPALSMAAIITAVTLYAMGRSIQVT
jgi:hypothetical protein